MSRTDRTALLATLAGLALAVLLISSHENPYTEGMPPVGAAVQLEDEAASCGRCGDGACVPSCGESALTCPKDCAGDTSLEAASCGRCGDGACVPSCGENALTCARDCAGDTSLEAASCGRCGDGQCVPSCGENSRNCAVDCGGTSA